MASIKIQNGYSTTTITTIPASGDFTVTLAQAPTESKGWITFDNGNASLREYCYYDSKSGSTVSIKAVNRTNPQAHSIGASAQINNIAEMFQYISDISSNFGYIEKKGGLAITVFGGVVKNEDSFLTIADTDFTLSASQTTYVYFNLLLNSFAITLNLVEAQLGVPVATVVTGASVVSTVTYTFPKLTINPTTGGGGGGLTNITSEVPAGIKNGVNTAFTIANTPVANGLSLFVGGQFLTEGEDYTISGLNITMVVPPLATDVFIARVISSINGIAGTIPWGNITGSILAQADLQAQFSTKATGSGTANGTNTGDETGASIRSKLGITTLSGTNTGDQTSIVGISGTKAQFNTAVTDADMVFTGDLATSLTMNTARLLGRTTASVGVTEEITVGSGLSLAGGILNTTPLGTQGFSLTKSGSQSIPQGATTRVTWDVETFDTNGFHSGSSGDVTLTTGYWIIQTTIELDSIGSGTTDLSLSINGGANTIFGDSIKGMASYNGPPTRTFNGYGLLYVATTSVIGVDISKTLGGSANANTLSRFVGVRLPL